MRNHERAALARLIRLGGDQLASELTEIYLDEMPRRVAIAHAALGEQDAAALANVAHLMKSSSAQLGDADLAATCETIEQLAERGDLAAAARALREAETRFEAFARWLAAEARSSTPAELGTLSWDPRPRSAETPLIAVIEDNVDNRLLVDAILGDRFELAEYGTGAAALVGMRSQLPALVLLDVSLPGMDGLEVLTRMRSDSVLRDVPVVAVTAHAMAGDRERYLAAGFDAYVAKPIDDRVLIDAVERLLSRRR